MVLHKMSYVKMDKDIENVNKILYIINISKAVKTECFCKCDLVFGRIVIYLLYYRCRSSKYHNVNQY